MEKIFVIINGVQYGPYTKAQIEAFVREGKLNESTMCWYEGLPQWQPLNTVFPQIFAQIPPMPPSSPPPVPGPQTYNPPQGKGGGGKGCCLGCSILLVIFLILIAVIGYFGWKYGKVYIKTYKYNYNSSILKKPVLRETKLLEVYSGKNEKG